MQAAKGTPLPECTNVMHQTCSLCMFQKNIIGFTEKPLQISQLEHGCNIYQLEHYNLLSFYLSDNHDTLICVTTFPHNIEHFISHNIQVYHLECFKYELFYKCILSTY